MKRHLTAKFVETATMPLAAKHNYVIVWDDQLVGFGLRVMRSGFKTFVWYGRIHGRLRKITIGQFPFLTVAQARAECFKIKSAVVRGEDPAEVRREARHELTFGDLVKAYLRNAEVEKLRSLPRMRRQFEQSTSRWTTRRASEIKREDVARLHHAIAESRGRVIANRVVTLIRRVFNFALGEGLFKGDNPVVRIKLFKEQARDRFLSLDEERRLNLALVAEPNPYWRAFFPLSLYLGTRKAELLGARWADVDLQAQTIVFPVTKTGNPRVSPLPDAAAAILEGLPSRGTSEWVFPSRGRSGHLVQATKVWQRICARAGIQGVTVHDLRRTLGSRLAASGVSLQIIGKALGHRDMRSTEVYARLNLDPVRAVLEANARLMLQPPDEEATNDADPPAGDH